MVGFIYKIIRDALKKAKRSIELRKYNPFTIAEYLRKQGTQVGENCMIIPTNLGNEPYLLKIGNHVTIAAGVRFITHDGGVWIFRNEIPDIQVFGPMIIEDNCVIGQDSVLFPNIRIGKNSIVGANSVVISDVKENSIVMGVPARPFGSVEKYKEKCVERWMMQKPPDIIIEQGANWWSSKHLKKNREKLKKHLLKVFSKELEIYDSEDK